MPGEQLVAANNAGIYVHHSFIGVLYAADNEGVATSFANPDKAKVKIICDVDMRTPGTTIRSTRPVAQS